MESARSIARSVGQGRTSAEDVVRSALQGASRLNVGINALSALFAKRAIATAKRVDQRVESGETLPLAGVPFVAKNLFDVRGEITLAGSSILRDAAPAARDAAAIAAMEQAGAVLIGTASMDEFAYGFTNETSHYGAVRNPLDVTRTAGGSSGGSAACVAAGIVPVALGTDTNGSVRVPASLCGIVGFKPGFGQISRTGVYPFVDSLDHVGVLTQSIDDAALCYRLLAGKSAPNAYETTDTLRVGVLAGTFQKWSGPTAQSCLMAAAKCFPRHESIAPRFVKEGRAAAFVMTAYEGGLLHLNHLRQHYQAMEPNSRDRLAAGALMPSEWYIAARAARSTFATTFKQLFDQFDILLSATTPVTAPRLGQDKVVINGEEHPVKASLGLLTQPVSCIGLPAITVPWPVSDGMPAGIQVIGPDGGEEAVLRVAMLLEHRAQASAPRLPRTD